MEKRIRIFKSFEEQEQFSIDEMSKTTPMQRFQNLNRMQQLTLLLHPPSNRARKIIIQKNGRAQ